jgi:hypothetical protein
MSGFNIADFAVLSGKLIAVSNDSIGSGWYYADLPQDLEPPVWTFFSTTDNAGSLRIAGQMAYQVVDDEDVFWVDALLCNSATVLNVEPFAVYIDPRDGSVQIKSWENNFPNDEDGTSDSMPHASRCSMWGDYLVLGDIVWKSDPDEPFDETNSSRYRHGLWFSIPGKTDTWDPIDTVFTGQKSGANVVQGIFPLEAGLLVVTCTLVALLQGTPDDFVYRELREGISNCGRNGVARWPQKGGVVFGNNLGDVWFTNGESFQKLDETIEIDSFSSIATYGEYVFVSTNEDVRVFRLYEESGGWTRLTGVAGFAKIITTPRFFIGIEARDADGSFILDDEERGLLDSEDTLWSSLRIISALDFESDERGFYNHKPLRSVIRTRPLPGFGHSVRFWHRFGVRAKGSGKITKGISRPSAISSDRGYETRVNGNLRRRFDYIFDAHGPSIEATFDIEFEGDVAVEHMTVWEHGGRDSR